MNSRVKAVTIIELMIVLIIISILATIAIPNFISSDEKNIGRNAEHTLLAIQKMQKRFFLRNGVYYTVNQATIIDPELRNDAITRNLKVTLERGTFNYNIIETTLGHPELGYNIIATRRPGARHCVNNQMFLMFDQINVTKTGCNLW